MQYTTAMFDPNGICCDDSFRFNPPKGYNNRTNRQRSSIRRLEYFRELASEGFVFYVQATATTRLFHRGWTIENGRKKRKNIDADMAFRMEREGKTIGWTMPKKASFTNAIGKHCEYRVKV